jgi:anti-sigma regulatory factor (Ser/Thr protein kinase)
MQLDKQRGLAKVGAAAIPSGPGAPSLARRLVSMWLDGRGNARLHDEARLLVSELVTNSVRHARLGAGELVRVGLAVSDGVVRLEVENPGGTGTIAAHEPDLERGGGFGLRIVEALAHAWGVSRDGHIRVWVQLLCWPATEALKA